MAAGGSMFFSIPGEAIECPICGGSVQRGRSKLLYDVPICRPCSNGFARRRQIAFAIDAAIWETAWQILLCTAAYFMITTMGLQRTHEILGGVFLEWIVPWIVLPLIFSFKDGFSGMSPGKRWMGLQVVDAATREPIGFQQSLRRNVGMIIPIVPVLIASQLRSGCRCGDRWAGTRVIWLKYRARPPFEPSGMLWCEACGYNVTGTVSGICPECAFAIERPMARPARVVPLRQPAPSTVG